MLRLTVHVSTKCSKLETALVNTYDVFSVITITSPDGSSKNSPLYTAAFLIISYSAAWISITIICAVTFGDDAVGERNSYSLRTEAMISLHLSLNCVGLEFTVTTL